MSTIVTSGPLQSPNGPLFSSAEFSRIFHVFERGWTVRDGGEPGRRISIYLAWDTSSTSQQSSPGSRCQYPMNWLTASRSCSASRASITYTLHALA